MEHAAAFDLLPWQEPLPGMRCKVFRMEEQTVRLIELRYGYCDPDWCTHAHISYILSGRFTVQFADHTEEFSAGDTVLIPHGEAHRHKAVMAYPGESMTMLSFEPDA